MEADLARKYAGDHAVIKQIINGVKDQRLEELLKLEPRLSSSNIVFIGNVSGDWRAHGNNDQHGNTGEQKRDADGCECWTAYICAPLPLANARQQGGKRIQQRQHKQRCSAASDPMAWSSHALNPDAAPGGP